MWFRLVAILILFVTLIQGCKCVRTPRDMRSQDRSKSRSKVEEAADQRREAPTATPSPTSSGLFETAQRLDALRQYYTLKRWDAVRHEGLALITAPLDDIVRLEVHLILAEAFQESGDRERADEFAGKFRKLHEELKGSERIKKQSKDREALISMVERMRARMPTDRYLTPDEEPRHGSILAKKLREAKADDVLEEQLPDGGQVFFSKNADALSTRLEGMDRQLATVIQRDPEYQYYYAVREPASDAKIRTGR